MQFLPIASSSRGCAYLVQDAGTRILVEAGVSFETLQAALGGRSARLSACLLSHRHGDHARSAFALARLAVPVYGPAAWVRAANEGHPCALEAEPGRTIEIGPVSATPFEVSHGGEQCLAWCLDSNAGRLLYMTDLVAIPDLAGAEHATVLAVECNHSEPVSFAAAASGVSNMARHRHASTAHLSVEHLVGWLRGRRWPRLAEVHLLHLSDVASDAERMADAIRKAVGVPVFVAPVLARGPVWT